MAATYSSFMTTRFYSPVFNTALFDGAFRIYFSQTYETSALKIYHLLQTEYVELWNDVRKWSLQSKEHVFLLIYPDAQSVQMIFDSIKCLPGQPEIFMQDWDEGLAVGLVQPSEQVDLTIQLQDISKHLSTWIRRQSLLDSHDVEFSK
ncbi:MAG: hypothetical protein A2622_01750 [Bdellovibrionales bacterium RIFCSPHIGHO2_01_FULL_40_29]|nr:MAG: hypothetical protein A2622_01750 [Bdellovibrionales bacterium RIFCSPHIGHO2_01_FULL_40_29]OFZ33817.1 MAG: hypothetical protein A3D17_02170 [Bdellovibrionales bacterium RIFCSPHIGHO2_02_FULL_40_15]